MPRPSHRLLPALACVLLAAPAFATPPLSPLFDPARHLRVSDVRPGMKGYCLTVFQGTAIERFDVEVVSVLRNQSPGLDSVLIRCTGHDMEHIGAAEGMSGSPVYLYTDESPSTALDRPAKLLGAFAFAFPFSKDPIAGVQPIENMLALADPKTPRSGSVPLAVARSAGGPHSASRGSTRRGKPRWTFAQARQAARALLTPAPDADAPASPLTASPAVTLSGVSPAAVARLRPILSAAGFSHFRAVPAGRSVLRGSASLDATAAASTRPADHADLTFQPGAALVIPLATGDADLSVLGTCTEVLGDRVFAFGHAFQSEGGVELPMGVGSVATIVPSLNISFKVGALERELGVLRADTSVGVSGTIGSTAPTVPMTVRVRYADGSSDRTYHYRIIRHPRITPLLAVSMLAASLEAERNLPAECTLALSSSLALPRLDPADKSAPEPLAFSTSFAGTNVPEWLNALLPALLSLSDNPFQPVYPESITAEFTVEGHSREAQLVSLRSDRSRYRAGEAVRLEVGFRPYRDDDAVTSLGFTLPADLPPGDYRVVVSDAQQFAADEAALRPDKLAAGSAEDLLGVLREQAATPSEAMYVRLEGTGSGIALGRVALPKIPASRRNLLESAGGGAAATSASPSGLPQGFAQGLSADPSAGATSPIRTSLTQTHPWPYVTTGLVETVLHVYRDGQHPDPHHPAETLPPAIPPTPAARTPAPKPAPKAPNELPPILPGQN